MSQDPNLNSDHLASARETLKDIRDGCSESPESLTLLARHLVDHTVGGHQINVNDLMFVLVEMASRMMLMAYRSLRDSEVGSDSSVEARNRLILSLGRRYSVAVIAATEAMANTLATDPELVEAVDRKQGERITQMTEEAYQTMLQVMRLGDSNAAC